MLTADLVRAWTRGGIVKPRYVDVADVELGRDATALIELFDSHQGETIGALDEAVADHIGDATDFMIRRGLVKLLRDRSTVETRAPLPPETVREVVFEEAAATWPVGPPPLQDRAAVMERAAERLELTVAQVEEALYADLKHAEVLVGVDLPEPVRLLERYNLALAQAVLLRARAVRVTLPSPKPARARALFRIVKFHRLMHRAERTAGGWTLHLDGPLSLFRQTQRYGLQLALFLPALCHCPEWSLEADVAWGPQRLPMSFAADHKTGLVTHGKDRGTWESEEERHFRKVFAKAKSKWKLRRATQLIDLDGRDVLVPDYVLTHEDGRRALLEIVWFWRRRSFERRLELLREAGPPNLVVAFATRLNTGEDDLPDLAHVVPFKGVIQPKRIIEQAEAIGIPP